MTEKRHIERKKRPDWLIWGFIAAVVVAKIIVVLSR